MVLTSPTLRGDHAPIGPFQWRGPGIGFEHARVAGELPTVHRDPFDRMLVAQAQVDALTLVTRDPVFSGYDVATLPA